MPKVSRQNLQEIIASKGGLHLTAYVQGSSDTSELRRKIGSIVFSALEQLIQGTPASARRKLLSPILSLMLDSERLKRLPSSFVIFRNQNMFRILQVSLPLEDQCFVANTFHVKPLLEWLQLNQDYLILTIERERAMLFCGNHTGINKWAELTDGEQISSLDISSTTRRRGRSAWDRNVSEWIQKELGKLPKRNRPKLYLAGEKSFVLPVFRKLRYRNISLTWAGNPIEEHSLSRIEAAIREELDAEAKSRIRQTFKEFHLADDLSLGCRNLFDIASAAVKGRVSKLVVSSDMQIFGKIDEASGRLKLNPGDSDHEDDDILDDLAQLVLANGGEVQLAPLSEMPKGWPAVAILHPAARENQLSTLSNSLKKSQQEIA